MSRTRILVMLILTSWTLNVALGVALFLKTQYPSGSYWSENTSGHSNFQRPPFKDQHGLSEEEFTEFRGEKQELEELRRMYLVDLAETFAVDQLDTVKLNAYADSIGIISMQLHKQQIHHMIRVHDKLPPHARRELGPRMMKRMNHSPRHFRRGRTRPELDQ